MPPNLSTARQPTPFVLGAHSPAATSTPNFSLSYGSNQHIQRCTMGTSDQKQPRFETEREGAKSSSKSSLITLSLHLIILRLTLYQATRSHHHHSTPFEAIIKQHSTSSLGALGPPTLMVHLHCLITMTSSKPSFSQNLQTVAIAHDPERVATILWTHGVISQSRLHVQQTWRLPSTPCPPF